MYSSKESHLVYPPSLNTQRILINSNDFLVLQDGFVFGPYGPQVHGHEERSGQNGPDGHLGLALFVTQSEIAYDQLKYQV